MHELARESISGTPGTAASLTVVAATSPAYPRLSDVAALGSMLHYTIEASDGRVVCTGVGKATAAGAFTRLTEFSQFDGTTYTKQPSALASLPSGCAIYVALSATTVMPVSAPASNVSADRWVLPNDNQIATSATGTFATTGRDHYWRVRMAYPHKVDAIAIHSTATANYDIGLYEVDWDTGNPGRLLIGWQGVSIAAGMNTILLSAATLGALSAASQRLPLGDMYWMLNMSAGGPGRTVLYTGCSGSIVSDLASPQSILYRSRTNNTSFGDAPTITGRLAMATTHVPMIALRGV